MHSVRWSQLRMIKSCSVSWSMSRSILSRTERSTCSTASSSLKWPITLSNGMIIVETSGTLSQASSTQGHDRYYLVLSESEYQSWQTYGWIRSPRVSNELVGPQDQTHHATHMLNRIGDAINHLYYLRVAHGFMFKCHSESGHGRYYLYSGTLRGKVEDVPEVSEETRARILRIVIDQDSMSYSDIHE